MKNKWKHIHKPRESLQVDKKLTRQFCFMVFLVVILVVVVVVCLLKVMKVQMGKPLVELSTGKSRKPQPDPPKPSPGPPQSKTV